MPERPNKGKTIAEPRPEVKISVQDSRDWWIEVVKPDEGTLYILLPVGLDVGDYDDYVYGLNLASEGHWDETKEREYFNQHVGELRESKKKDMKMTTFEEYQLAASETAIYSDSLKVMYPAMGLAGEVGEVLNKVKKHYRDGTELDTEGLTKELGDVLWYLAALATDLDIDLEDAAGGNLTKLQSRMERGVIGGSGDYR